MFVARLDSSLADNAAWQTPAAMLGLLVRADYLGRTTLSRNDAVLKQWSDPLEALAWLDVERRQNSNRWIGFIGYELGRWFEPKAGISDTRRKTSTPLFAFGEIDRPIETIIDLPSPDTGAAVSNFDRGAYLNAVRRCVEFIAAGDVFQINLSQRLTLNYSASAATLYARLLANTPAAFGGMIDLGDVAIISNSPELFLHVDIHRRVITRPIKGTRRNAPGMYDELLRSPKEAAELNMIVDLERNDLGRICEVGTVRVSQLRTIEAHPTILHGVATVEGLLRKDVGLVKLLAATFPSGSVTGAPKIRAMQIIDELEPEPRGVYCGAMGYLDPDGSLTFNVAIRTATLARGRLVIPVGGGIVAESDPLAELDETYVKARALLTAAGGIAQHTESERCI